MPIKGQKIHNAYNKYQIIQTKFLGVLKKANLIAILFFTAALLATCSTEKTNAAAIPSSQVTIVIQEDKQEAQVENRNQTPILVEYGSSIESFIPKGWKLIKQTAGDLNDDGFDDIVGVIEYDKPYQRSVLEAAPPRILFIALRDKDEYHLLIQKDNFILKADQGGVWGDPFSSISVDRGSLLIKFYGGSNYRWAYDCRFRYQKDGWYLIGYTAKSWFTGNGSGKKEDYNLLTGVEIISTIDKNVVVYEETINFDAKELGNLRDLNGPFDCK